MNHLKKKKSFSYRDLLYKALIFVATVTVIVYFLPRDGKFNYQFDINKPWKYGQLIATFNFPIYKDNEVVKREQDSLLSTFQPYYQLDKNIETNALNKLKEDYHNHLKGILPSTDYIRYIERTLKDIYTSGILSTEDAQSLNKDSTEYIRKIDNKLAKSQAISGTYTVKKAYEHLLSADTAHYNRNILRQCALNEYIFPNLIYDQERSESTKKEILDNYSWSNGVVVSGQKIIDRGEIVDQGTYNILESLRKESIKRSESLGQKRLILGGQILFVSTQQQRERRKPARFDARYIVRENRYRRMTPEEHEAMYRAREAAEGRADVDYAARMQAFCARKYNSVFSREMSRSAAVYLRAFSAQCTPGTEEGNARGVRRTENSHAGTD